MNKYDRLMREILEYIEGTRLTYPSYHRKGEPFEPITGSSLEEIEAAEAQVGRKIPAALKAWYRVAGKVPVYFRDHEADYALKRFVEAQEVLRDFLEDEDDIDQDEFPLVPFPETMLPFLHRLWDPIFALDLKEGNNQDDPPVFYYDQVSLLPTSIAFSVHIRDMCICWFEFSVGGKDYLFWSGHENSQERRSIYETLREEIHALRRQLLQEVHLEDLARDEITGPVEFQKRWVALLDKSEIKQKYESHGLRIPYYWVMPPT